MIIHSGPGAEFTGNVNDIWSHKWGITPQSRDGVLISSYAIMPEYWSTPGDITIGVFAHELGHVFGLPDLYDRDGSSRGVGRWSLMATGAWNGSLGNSPAHLDAWCKVQLGFVTPIVPTTRDVIRYLLKDAKSVNTPDWNMMTMMAKDTNTERSPSLTRRLSINGERSSPPITLPTIGDMPYLSKTKPSIRHSTRSIRRARRMSEIGENRAN